MQVSQAEYESVWGEEYGKEIAIMLKAFEKEGDWTKPYGEDVVTAEDLGIKEELIGLREALEKEKHRL